MKTPKFSRFQGALISYSSMWHMQSIVMILLSSSPHQSGAKQEWHCKANASECKSAECSSDRIIFFNVNNVAVLHRYWKTLDETICSSFWFGQFQKSQIKTERFLCFKLISRASERNEIHLVLKTVLNKMYIYEVQERRKSLATCYQIHSFIMIHVKLKLYVWLY